MATTWQSVTVIPLVLACGVYSAWALMPAALRRPLAVALARLPLIGRLQAVARAAQGPVGCGCDGCDRAAPAGEPVTERSSVVRVVPRRPAR